LPEVLSFKNFYFVSAEKQQEIFFQVTNIEKTLSRLLKEMDKTYTDIHLKEIFHLLLVNGVISI